MGACDIGEQAVYNALVVMNQREREAASFPLSTPHTHLPDAAALARFNLGRRLTFLSLSSFCGACSSVLCPDSKKKQ
jgi:hypothetical protein